MSYHHEASEPDHLDYDSIAEEENCSPLKSPTRSIITDTNAHNYRGRSGISTPARIALGASASRLAAPSPVVDPNGLGWPGKSVPSIDTIME